MPNVSQAGGEGCPRGERGPCSCVRYLLRRAAGTIHRSGPAVAQSHQALLLLDNKLRLLATLAEDRDLTP